MPKPPPSGPHSDIHGVNRDARAGKPNRDPAKGGAAERDAAQAESKAQPPEAGARGKG